MTVGYVTIENGEQALVFRKTGEARIEVGPQRLFLWREKLFPMLRYSADQNSYLVIKYRNGKVEHKAGPCVEYYNKLQHSIIEKKSMIALDANEVLVVYRHIKTNEDAHPEDTEVTEVKRYIMYGPCMFMPEANEWLHQFFWHGTDPSNKTRKVPNQLKFNKLWTIPDQFYFNVDEVRTADDALIRIKLMLFFELKNLEKMLNSTKDPIGDFINCLTADVMAFTSKYTYMEFIENSNALNLLSNYPQLLERCQAIGYEASKIVFRGYFAHDALQKLHDNAIEKRTELKLTYEREEQYQELTDMKLRNEMERLDKEQRMEFDKETHEGAMEISKLKHRLDLECRKEEDKLTNWLKDKESELHGKTAKDNQDMDHNRKLHGHGVDITKYLLSEMPQPDKLTRIVTSSDPKIHFHQNAPPAVTNSA